MKGRSIIIASLLTVLTACGGQAPQRPSQRKSAVPQADTAALALMEMNQQLAEAADEQLYRYAQAQPESYALYEQGTWVHMFDSGDAQRGTIQAGEECTLHLRISSLNGKLYSDAEQTARAGKYELPAAIDENITEWRHEAQMRLLAPWYAAYGIKGKGNIPPYENIVIDLEIR